MSSISFNGNVVDPTENENISRDSQNTNYIYVQGKEDLTHEQQLDLEGVGVQFQEYLGDNAYLCRYEPHDLTPIRDKDYVRAANCFHRKLKVEPDLKGLTESRTIDILFHKGAMSARDAAAYLRDAGVEPSTVEVAHRKIRAQASPEALDRLKDWESVKSIEEVLPVKLYNNFARDDMEAETILPASHNAGDGQVISVNDTGFDRGGTPGRPPTDVHPAFTGRIKNLRALGRPGSSGRPGLTNDPFSGHPDEHGAGHGTHVCGSIAGNGFSEKMGGIIQGTAPSATLVVTSLRDGQVPAGLGGIPPDIYGELFEPPYEQDSARISSNSYGIGAAASRPPKQRGYDSNARAIDRFVWHHPDCVILYAAGNDRNDPGVPPQQIGDWAAAKNCITVAATFSSRSSRSSNGVPGNPREIAWFSSAGPLKDGRMKPDIAAPGVSILSTCSRDPTITDTIRQQGGPTSDDLWMFMSGTSMSTPLVAGCCAVLRQAVQAAGFAQPTAALIKALLINGALASGETHDSAAKAKVAPDGDFGFGTVDMEHSLAGVSKTLMQDEDVGLRVNEAKSYIIAQSPDAKRPGLKVTLVYTDRAGPKLQGNLVLSITHGSATESDTSQVVENNVQQIIVHQPSYPVRLTVTAKKLPPHIERYPYALVWQFIDGEDSQHSSKL